MFLKMVLAMVTSFLVGVTGVQSYNSTSQMQLNSQIDNGNITEDDDLLNIVTENKSVNNEEDVDSDYEDESINSEENNVSDTENMDEEMPDDPYMANYNATDDDPWYDVDTESCPYHTYESSVGYVPDDDYYFIQYRCPYCGDTYEEVITEEEYNLYTE